MIRDYEPHHRPQLRACMVELQDFERNLQPALPEGEQMADAYLGSLFEKCARWCGKVFVAEVDNAIVGFVGVLSRVPPETPDEARAHYAYISDLVVLPPYRRRGIGSALLKHAEAFARDNGAKTLRIGVLAGNPIALNLYHRRGFVDYHVQLVKVI
jgi:ribosomal protein S18 acetylase RimI-like enzyme